MPPRYSYWTILAGGLPTSFRAASREDLLPTLRRLKDRHPDAEMKWFARGRLWPSPEAAREESRSARTPRSRDWRPGGEHRDPRGKYAALKQKRNLTRREQRFKRKHAAPVEHQQVEQPRSPGSAVRTPAARDRHRQEGRPRAHPQGGAQRAPHSARDRPRPRGPRR